ncbi:Phosphatidylinositol-4-phosphate 5-kinase [Puccinia graminis f. sp. tritici]|uniref:Phosphatidylinositol-4-phosphate 5-kinase n=1 Tax=Puccinia graminis f. sp. tritici TaxID=56615 RepID=A0A5B0Q531_PUCGR|nr:Phosphatidylinositol-4-phosphate 5-kinase [Puccinia graminis f. sp. tritici]
MNRVGNELTPSAKYDFKFKDYAPWVFREIREYFHLDPAEYLLSLTAKYILSELGSPGKSGSFFYFSRDYRFIIKTIHPAENKFLRSILKDYHLHVKANPHTLLSRFYGLHRVKLPRGPKIHFVIMNNLFPPHRDIHETFDLKGSAVGREYPEEKAKAGAVLKDLNWVHRGRRIELGPTKKGLFEEQLKRDTSLLQQLGIMDYSLLIGLHDMARGNSEGLRDDQLRVFQPVTDGPSVGGPNQPTPNPSLSTHPPNTHHHQQQQQQGGSPPIAGPSNHPNNNMNTNPTLMGSMNNNNNNNNNGGSTSLHRKSTTTKRVEQELAASALRKAIQSSDPQLFSDSPPHRLPLKDRFMEKKKFIFYQDEGGFMASDDANQPLPVIYYLGIIDILTPYSFVKKFEHFWKGMSHDKDMISAVPPVEYGDRFMNFLFSIIRNGNLNLRPRMEERPRHPLHLNSTQKHLYTTLSHLNPTPKHLYPTPIHLYPTPIHLYPTPIHLYPTPIHLYPTPIHLYTTPNHLYTTPNHLNPTPKHLYTTPNYLNPTLTLTHLKQLRTISNNSEPSQTTPNHLTSHTTLTTTTMPPTRSSGRNTRSSSSLKSSNTKQNSNSKKRKAPRSLPTKKNSSRKRSGVNQEQDDDEEEEPEEEEEQEEEDEPEEEQPDSEQDQPDQEEEREEEEESINLTLENFQTQLGSWSINKLREVLGKRKKSCSNRVPPEVQDALLLLQQNYIKSKLMLSIIGNITETTTAKYL